MSRKKDPSLAKIIFIVVAVAAIAFGSYKLIKKNGNSDVKATDEVAKEGEIFPSGLDASDSVRNVGDVEKVIAKWVEANPKAIITSVVNMQSKAMQEQTKEAQKNIGVKKAELFDNASDGRHSPAGYDVSIVEFFDYNCGYCKKAHATVESVLKEDAKIRVIYKEFPILGQASHDLAQVSIAVNQVDSASYKKFHDAMMKSSERTKAGAIKVAKSVGVNVAKVESYLKSNKAKIDKIIQDNLTLGTSVGVTGTPGFVIGEELIPGAPEAGTFKDKISALRGGAAKPEAASETK